MLKILIAEDEEPIANLIRVNLTRAGYECTCACDGEEAADQMENGHFDLLLLDIMLPKINGYELMEYAKILQLPVIFITAMGTTEHKVKGLKMGAEDYISKPFEIVELLARVETVMRRYNKIGKTIRILDVEIDHGRGEGSGNPSAVFSLRLPRHQPHSDVLVSVSGLDCVYTVEEF